jgi:hypothetical protein
MIFENFYTDLDNKININSISSYKIIMKKFINKYINLYSFEYINENELYNDAIIYSKYYVYYKINNCIYSNKIMEIIYNIEFNFNKN